MTILPTDQWTPEPNRTYELASGTHNTVLLPDPRGITIVGRPGAVIVPTAPYECGVYCDNKLQAEDITLRGLDIRWALVDGIHFMNGDRITVNGCIITGSWNMGVALHGCNRSVLARCEIVDSFAHAAYLSGDGITVVGCRITRTSRCGLHLWTDAPGGVIRNATLIGNIIRYTGKQAIVARCDDAVTVLDNYVDTAMTGVEVHGAGGVLVGNTIRSVTHWQVCVQRCTAPVRVVGKYVKVFDDGGMVR